MDFKKIALSFIFIIHTLLLANQDEKISINFADLSIEQLIHITSKQIQSNILIVDSIEGKVDFVSNKSITKNELLHILKTVLNSKGYELIHDRAIYKIVKQKKVSKSHLSKQVKIITLKNADVITIETVLKELLQKQSSKKALFISKDISTNSIILFGEQQPIKFVQSVIKKLDKEKYQVYVEAKIIELSENRTKNLGVKYGLSAIQTSGNTIFTLGTNLGGLSNAMDKSVFSLFSLDSQTLKSALSLGATLNFLKENQVIDIVSQPSILCMNNEESTIYVGETKSFQTGNTTTDGGTTNNSFQREDIGLTLKIKPRVSNNKKVVLKIETIQEDARELKQGQINPDTTKKEVKTTAIVTNGESVILGGLIKNKTQSIKTGVPFFSDIPILGHLFKNSKDAQDKINLVIIITPYIVPTSKNLTQVTQELSQLKALQTRFSQNLKKNLEKNSTQSVALKSSENIHKEHLKSLGLPYE